MELNSTGAIRLLQYEQNNTVIYLGENYYKDSNSDKIIYNKMPSKTNYVKIRTIDPDGIHPYYVTNEEEPFITGWVDEDKLKEISDNLQSIQAKELELSLKYFGGKVPYVCYMSNSLIYKKNQHMTPKGIVWNSTGVNMPYLYEYVQSDNAEDEKIIGLNTKGNDYNHTLRNDGYNAWIGKNIHDKVMSVQTLPWDMRAAGCGEGKEGSADNQWIQINICEDVLNNSDYFYAVYEELIHLTAYLCELFKIDPLGTVPADEFSTTELPTIMDHQEAYKLGYASPRTDVFHWFKKYDKNMRKAREEIAFLIANTTSDYTQLEFIPTVDIPEVEAAEEEVHDNPAYVVVVNANRLNVRKGPSQENEVLTTVSRDTILLIREYDEAPGWGQILDTDEGGWINLQYVEKIN